MNRRNFFKKLGIGTATIVVTPMILNGKDSVGVKVKENMIIDISAIPDNISLAEYMSIYERTGILLTNSYRTMIKFKDHESGISWSMMYDPRYDGPLENYLNNPNYKVILEK